MAAQREQAGVGQRGLLPAPARGDGHQPPPAHPREDKFGSPEVVVFRYKPKS